MICNTFKQLATNTWQNIQQSRTVNFQLKEETFTDVNMLAIKIAHPANVRTKVFTKHEEGVEGADWEWWFRSPPKQWLGVRVQAKIINIQTDEFEHLHYKSKSNTFQCDKLIQRALSQRVPLIPLYCLYLQTNTPTQPLPWQCHTYKPQDDLMGCSLVSAFTIKKLQSKLKRGLSDLQTTIKPWHCLVGCKGYIGSSSVEKMNGYIKANFDLVSTTPELDVTVPETFITEKPPQYVLDILENENNDNIPQELAGLRGILIYTFQEEEELNFKKSK